MGRFAPFLTGLSILAGGRFQALAETNPAIEAALSRA